MYRLHENMTIKHENMIIKHENIKQKECYEYTNTCTVHVLFY